MVPPSARLPLLVRRAPRRNCVSPLACLHLSGLEGPFHLPIHVIVAWPGTSRQLLCGGRGAGALPWSRPWGSLWALWPPTPCPAPCSWTSPRLLPASSVWSDSQSLSPQNRNSSQRASETPFSCPHLTGTSQHRRSAPSTRPFRHPSTALSCFDSSATSVPTAHCLPRHRPLAGFRVNCAEGIRSHSRTGLKSRRGPRLTPRGPPIPSVGGAACRLPTGQKKLPAPGVFRKARAGGTRSMPPPPVMRALWGWACVLHAGCPFSQVLLKLRSLGPFWSRC